MRLHIALITDRTGRYAHVWGSAPTWSQFHDQLEDAGCEVIEDQTIEWDGCTKMRSLRTACQFISFSTTQTLPRTKHLGIHY
jgi:hypothetical protein